MADKALLLEIGALPPNEFKKRWEKLKSKDLDAAKDFLYYRCGTDLELYALVYFLHYCKQPFNQFHRDLFSQYEFGETGKRRYDGAPRGYAKSTFKALIKPIHDVCYGLEKYILIFSSTKPLADAKLKDIRREFLYNDDLIGDYGISFTSPKPGATNFIVGTENGETMLQSIGAGAETRGLRFGEWRPTKIILDDVEDSEQVFNEELREKQADWYYQVVSNLGTEETNLELVGTVLHKKSLLKRLSQNPAYRGKIYKAIISWADNQGLWDQWAAIYSNLDDEDRLHNSDSFYYENQEAMLKGSEVLWPEREPYLFLMKERIEKGHRSFMKEKQNDPISDEEALFGDFYWYTEVKEGLLIEETETLIPWKDLYAYGVIDPATGESKAKSKTKLDFTCLLSGYKDLQGRLFVHKDWTKRARPTQYIAELFECHAVMQYEKFAIETNLYRTLLLENIIRERKRREKIRRKAGIAAWALKIPFYDIENRDKKEKRIFTLEPKVSNKWILFNKRLSVEFKDQMEQFPNGDHDDGPDALEMLWGLINNRYAASPLNLDPRGAR